MTPVLNLSDLSKISVNGIKATCFKRPIENLMLERMTPADSSGQNLLDHEWSLWSTSLISLNIKDHGTKKVPSFLTILGLKMYIEELNPQKGNHRTYVISDQISELDDDLTLSESGLGDGHTVFVGLVPENSRTMTIEQSSIEQDQSFEAFDDYYFTMQTISSIVCRIHTAASTCGSGFLIARDLIFTNEHVLSNGRTIEIAKNFKLPKGDQAEFFFDSPGNQGIKVNLLEVIDVSKKPGGIKQATAQNLDYCIVKIDIQSLPAEQRHKLEQIAPIAVALFQRCAPNYDRANIIQHPSFHKQQQPKYISFKENKIHKRLGMEMHYSSGTRKGSSGSIVVNNKGELLGPHRATCGEIERKLCQHYSKLQVRINEFFKENGNHHSITINALPDGTVDWSIDPSKKGNGLLILLEDVNKLYPTFMGEKQPKRWACDFLQIKNLEDHILCNTGVEIERIFRSIDKDPDVKTAIAKSQQIENSHPSESLSQLKDEVRRYRKLEPPDPLRKAKEKTALLEEELKQAELQAEIDKHKSWKIQPYIIGGVIGAFCIYIYFKKNPLSLNVKAR